jgi:endo-1,4-beta-xylanase
MNLISFRFAIFLRCCVIAWLGLTLISSGRAEFSVIPANGILSATLQRPDSSYATSTQPTVSGESFTRAVQTRVLKEPANSYNIQLSLRTTAAVTNGDVLSMIFYLRKVAASGSSAVTTVVFEKASADYDRSFGRTYSVDSTNWTRFEAAFTVVSNYAASAAQINFQLGYPAETIEMGGLTVTNFGKSFSLSTFSNEWTYPGRQTDAPWRAAAAARIAQIRKANLTVQIVDQHHNFVTNAPVRFQQRRHAFGFGSAVDAQMLLGNTSDSLRYQGVVTQYFNKVVLENDLKWPNWEQNRARATNAVKWLRQRGIAVRGHNLIWPSWRWMPADVKTLSTNTTALRARINNHFMDELSATKGQLVEWDVLNEPIVNHDVQDILGVSEMAEWFRLARHTDPFPKLFVNEYDIYETPGTSHQNAYFNTIQLLLTNSAPLDGLGFQSHFSSYLPAPEEILRTLDRFSTFGLDLEATEFDINMLDEQLQADYTRDFMTALFSHPQVNGLLMWGFWEGRHWLPAAASYRKNWTIKPNGQAWMDLIARDWWSTEGGVTDGEGRIQRSVFKGDYEIEYASFGVTNRMAASVLSDKSSTVIATNLASAGTIPPDFSVGRHSSGRLEIHVENHGNLPAILLESPDLRTWTPVLTNTASTFSVTNAATGDGARFFTVKLGNP